MIPKSSEPSSKFSEDALQFDILTGPIRAEAALKEIATVRNKMSISELGTLAGVGVLEQFRVAKAETSIAWLTNPTLALSGFYALLGVIIPALSLIAGIAIDVAVFGGAAEGLTKHGFAYYGFCVGALIFAAGFGLTKKKVRYLLLAISMIACLGASVLVSDSHEFRDHFANSLPWLMGAKSKTSSELSSQKEVVNNLVNSESSNRKKESEIAASRSKRVRNTSQIYATEADRAADHLKTELQELGRLEANQSLVADDISVRIFGALYIFSWLLASQLVVAAVIRRGPRILAAQRETYAKYNTKRLFVRDLEGIRSERSASVVAAAVSDMLMRFNRILTVASAGTSDKTNAFAALFEADSLQKMTRVGVELVCLTLTSAPDASWTPSGTTSKFYSEPIPEAPDEEATEEPTSEANPA